MSPQPWTSVLCFGWGLQYLSKKATIGIERGDHIFFEGHNRKDCITADKERHLVFAKKEGTLSHMLRLEQLLCNNLDQFCGHKLEKLCWL